MEECIGKYFILNGSMVPAEYFDSSLIYEGESIYEVLRMSDGIPVFFHDHINRMLNGTRHQGRAMPGNLDSLRRDIKALSSSQKLEMANLKIVFNYNKGISNCLLYFIEAVYPAPEQYKKGVKGILYHAERKDPVSKILNNNLRSEIYLRLIAEDAYEALLVNRQDLITEGSRSNILFIRDNQLFTCPDNMILSGITRKYLLDICREMDIKVTFECVNAASISGFESVILTGTSPVVLPFSSIGDHVFSVTNPIISRLRNEIIKKMELSKLQFKKDFL